MAFASVSGGFVVNEGQNGGIALSFNDVSNSSIQYQYSFTPGTADTSDYSGGSGSGSLSIVAIPSTDRTVDIRFSAAADRLLESEETVTLSVSLSGIAFADGASSKDFDITIRDRSFTNDRDDIIGTSGSDRVSALSGDDRFNAGAGVDVVRGGAGSDRLFGQAGSDRLFGGEGSDVLVGGGGEDLLQGGGRGDDLKGGAKSDVLRGQNGKDVLTGGSGRDTFVFDGNDGSDTITDWEAGDTFAVESGARRFRQLDLEETEDGVVVSWRETSVLLEGVERVDLSASDFHFG